MPHAPDRAALLRLLEATWPAAALHPCGPFVLRDGAGGGKRVSAATVMGAWSDADIARAEAAMRLHGTDTDTLYDRGADHRSAHGTTAGHISGAGNSDQPLFRLGLPDDGALDAALAARGYARVDPTLLLIAPLNGPRAAPAHPVYALWPPLMIQTEVWQADGITAPRRAVMDRVAGTKTALLGRLGDRPAGVAFIAMGGDGAAPGADDTLGAPQRAGPNDQMAMMHALAVQAAHRRAGLGRSLVLGAMDWAHQAGAHWLALAVTEANTPALGLYAGLGFTPAGAYHYRVAPSSDGVSRSP